jgi:hypothetical protein
VRGATRRRQEGQSVDDVATAGYVVHGVHPASFYPRSRLSRRSAFLAYVASSPDPPGQTTSGGATARLAPAPPRLAQSSPSGPPDGNPRACEILTSLGAVLAAATRQEIDERGVATGERATRAGQAGSRPGGSQTSSGGEVHPDHPPLRGAGRGSRVRSSSPRPPHSARFGGQPSPGALPHHHAAVAV